MSTGNTRYGAHSLQSNTTINSNSSAFGLCALRDSTNLNNTAVGAYSGTFTTTGQSNVSLGTNSLLKNTTGSYNTALGTGAMCFNETGNNNTSVGSNSLENNSGDSNTAVGTSALFANTTGTRNTAVGKEALIANTVGAKNTAIGQLALKTNTTGSQNVAVGDLALQLNNSANDNVAVGFHSLFNSTGGSNIGVGSYTLAENTGAENVAIGHASLSNKTTGNGNVSVGAHSLEKNLTENENTAIGYYALYNNTSGKNTALGSYALQNSTTCNNSVALGFNAMKNGNANQSVAIGSQAAESSSGTLNVSVGRLALFSNTTGGNNVAIGGNAGYIVTTGANNTLLGCQADVTSNSINNSSAIGYGAKANASNQIMMGTIAEQVVIPGSGVLSNTDPASYALSTSIVPKSYVDSMAVGLAPTSSCSCATTENISLSGLQKIDDYQTKDGDRVLVKSQGTTTSATTSSKYTSNVNNGIYIASSGNWSRAPDCDNGADVKGQITFVENGTSNGFTSFNIISSSAIVGTSELTYGIFYSTNFSLKNGLEVIDSGLNIKKELSGFLNFVGINSGTNTNYSLDTGTKDALINNVTVGKGSGNVSTNTAIGFQALKNYSSGSGSNTAIGYQAGSTITSSANNTLLGYLADVTSNSINNSTAIGYNAKASASNQIMMGTATEQVFIPGRLSATGDTSLGSKLTVTGDTSLGSKLNVTGETTLNSNLIVNNGTTTLKNRLTVSGGLSVQDSGLTVTAGGLTVTAGDLIVSSGYTTLADKLTVNNGGLAVVGTTTLGQSGSNTSTTVNGTLTVTGTCSASSFTGNASTATHISGGLAGQLLYQLANNTTEKLNAPTTSNNILTYNTSSSAPQWSATIPAASVSGTAVNLTDTQNISGAKTFTSILTASGGLSVTNNNATFSNSVAIGSTTTPNTKLSISPGATEAKITLYDGGNTSNHYGFGVSNSTLNYHVSSTSASHKFYAGGKNGDGTLLMTIDGTGTCTANSFIGIASSAANISSGSVGQLLYQSGVGQTSKLDITSTNNSILTFNTATSKPQWSANIPVGSVSGTAVNLSDIQTITGSKTFSNSLMYSGTIAAGTNSTQVATTAFLYSCLVKKFYFVANSTLLAKDMFGNISIDLNLSADGSINLQCPGYPNYMDGLVLRIRQTNSRKTLSINTQNSSGTLVTNAICYFNTYVPSTVTSLSIGAYYSYELIYMSTGSTTPATGALGCWYVTNVIN